MNGILHILTMWPWLLGGYIIGVWVQKASCGDVVRVPNDLPVWGYWRHWAYHWKGCLWTGLKSMAKGHPIQAYHFMKMARAVWKSNEKHRVMIVKMARRPKELGIIMARENIRYTIQLSATCQGIDPHLEELLQQGYGYQLRNYLIVEHYLAAK